MFRRSLCCFWILLTCGACFAEQHALLIGIGTYANSERLTLEGPANDVPALRRELIDRWHVDPRNISVLMDDEATRAAILSELRDLVASVRSGDRALIYYSGHGTSAYDSAGARYGLDLNTGAILPSDIPVTSDPGEILSGLLVGARDLRPLFEELDRKGVRTLVLFDACYSGDTAKSIRSLTPRNADFLWETTEEPRSVTTPSDESVAQDQEEDVDVWPYENVIYVSASARHEVAWDISAALARTQRPTIDGLAHGAFTNFLLAGSTGAADTNHDGDISYSELHGFLVISLQRDGQTPQLHPEARALVTESIMISDEVELDGQQVASSSLLRIRINEQEQEVRERIGGIPGLEIVTSAYDLEILGQAPAYRLMHSGGAPVTPDDLTTNRLVELIRRRALAHRLTTMEFPRQDFNVRLTMDPDQGAYYEGERTTIRLTAEQDCWLILISIDIEGNAYVVYPNRPADAQPLPGWQTLTAVELQAAAPFGTEIIRAFAFTEKPGGYDELVEVVLLDEDRLQRLIADLERDADLPGRSQTGRTTLTTPR